ncbi:MAG: hypothetical protein Greene101449_1257, partial [Candidatus Peregrinibacteria bacterium Greene1014_49]
EARCLAATTTEEEELGTPDLGDLLYFDAGDYRTAQGEYLLHPYTRSDSANGKRSIRRRMAVMDRNNESFENLHTILIPFADFFMDSNGIARTNNRHIRCVLFGQIVEQL